VDRARVAREPAIEPQAVRNGVSSYRQGSQR
jgi:hypothetical protein